MASLIVVQEDIKQQISRAKINFKKSPKERLCSTVYLQTRVDRLEQQWLMFFSNHIKIMSEVKKTELQSLNYCIHDEVEEMYIDYKSELLEALNNASSTKSTNSANPVTSCKEEGSCFKLPEVKIPTFSGKYIEWEPFRQLFLGVIHNNKRLDNAQRLYYLKGYLTGEAEALVRNITCYTDAWDKLGAMYNNKKFLVKGILKRLFDQKSLSVESAPEIKKIISTTTDCLSSLKNLKINIASWDILIIYIISLKLDKDTRKAWELKISSDPTDELPTYNDFADFLTGRYRGLENLDNKAPTVKGTQSFHAVNDSQKSKLSCAYCAADHKIVSCKKFANQTTDQRRSFVKEKELCYVCLGSNHSVRTCKSFFKCHICKRRHHTLLHSGGGSGLVNENNCESQGVISPLTSSSSTSERRSLSDNAEAPAKGSDKSIVSCLSTGNCKSTVLLPTALVNAVSKGDIYQVIRVLLDQGSQGSFITESMVQYLKLNKTPTKHLVSGVGGHKTVTSNSTVRVKLHSRVNPSCNIEVHAYVLKSITSLLPVVHATKVEWDDLREDDLADPEYHRPNNIDLLLGAEVYSQIIKEGLKKSSDGVLVAQDTVFGWVLSGPISTSNRSLYSSISVMHANIQSDDLLRKFWELENEPSNPVKILTEEEIQCEKLYTATTRRDDSGRYIVRLPFRNSDISRQRQIESRAIAERRLKNLEVKLSKNIPMKKEYAKVIQEYNQLNHMIEVPRDEQNKGLYLPHHAVVRDDKQTSKVRVVFDASCKGSDGLSLNDNLMVGPTLQAELRHTIMRWRTHKVCLVADIEKMYRQVLIDRRDTVFQRILWRDNPECKVMEYEMLTATFGTASAPFLAVRTLHQVANDECELNSDIAKIILNDFYMDDLLSGAETAEKCFSIFQEINRVLGKGGFQLRKWNSNDRQLLEMIKEGNSENGEIEIKTDDITKMLGLTWDPCEDCFQYSITLSPVSAPVTKRKIISDVSRLFDPLGWLAPTIISAKVLIQKLWQAGVGWDEEVPNNILKEWNTYRTTLPALVNVKIPRWLHTDSDSVTIELHGFADASKVAYAAVVYLRVVNKGGVNVSIVTSKTKVAPIKQISIPRLELCGAVLLAKLMVEVARVMQIPKCNIHAYTDSEVVLAWLNNHPSHWKTFVANRVSEILTTLESQHWSHVGTKLNPADCASRGIPPVDLSNTSLWFKGPDFLRDRDIVYKRPRYLATNLEVVRVQTAVVETTIWTRYSSLSRLVRVLAYCRRFLSLRRNTTVRHSTWSLSTQEIEEATNICIKKCQEELGEITDKQSLHQRGLKSLNLFVDTQNIIRVGGRLEMSQLNYNERHPILIPKDSFLTDLLIAEAHKKTMHGGPNLMIAYLRANFWVIGVKVLVKVYCRNCVTCTRYSAKATAQLMGQLPSARVTPAKPFLISGVDYAGPINIRVSKGRGVRSYKGYIALFICMSTRAIHLEAVSELTTQAFLAAFRRFVSRRGRCTELYSDNASNFIGASRELLYLFNEEKSNINPELAEYLATNGTQWRFIPPRAPNFGGLWEAGVKSTKFHLKRVVGNSTLTFEELSTVLTQIEACLNSRPLYRVEDQQDLTVLTPGHFLVGEPLVLPPDYWHEYTDVSNLRRWQFYQRMVKDFWRRWSQDYLHQFLQRNKWQHQNPEPSLGSIVLVKEDDMPPGKWLLGQIEQKHPGPDQITRVVTIRTKNSTFKRPVSKLCLLPVLK